MQAQSEIEAIDTLVVDIWPEYDREAVLVLLTGLLPADATLPATITIPIPENADLNAVARITDDGNLFDDITFDDSVSGQVTLTTPDPRFRVEYYFPYDLEEEERSFNFEWQADVAVNELRVSVQEPVDTINLTTEPAAFSVTPRQDGFQYHNLSPETLSAGDSFSLQVTYSRSSSELSAGRVQPAVTTGNSTNNQSQTSANSDINWPTIVLASVGAAILAVGAWMLFGERLRTGRKAPTRPKPVRNRPSVNEPETAVADETTTYVQFCHHCGQKSDPSDRFCRSCGTRLKT